MKERISREVERHCALANVPVPPISFDLTGVFAGICYQDHIEYNLEIANRYPDTFLIDTVPHEIAHWVDFVRNDYQDRRHPSGRRDMHGKYFKAIAKELGAQTATYHSYAVTSKRAQKRWAYKCECPLEHEISTITHNRMQKGQIRVCKSCGGELKFIGKEV